MERRNENQSNRRDFLKPAVVRTAAAAGAQALRVDWNTNGDRDAVRHRPGDPGHFRELPAAREYREGWKLGLRPCGD